MIEIEGKSNIDCGIIGGESDLVMAKNWRWGRKLSKIKMKLIIIKHSAHSIMKKRKWDLFELVGWGGLWGYECSDRGTGQCMCAKYFSSQLKNH